MPSLMGVGIVVSCLVSRASMQWVFTPNDETDLWNGEAV